MRSRIFLILLLLCMGMGSIVAQTPEIHSYLLFAGPGNKVYNVFGHSFIRMYSPTAKLDFCFSFEIDTEKSGAIDFVRRRSKAGFVAVETPMFLKQYADEHRGMKQYELNLTYREKQNLWRLLDEEVERGSEWTFDYYNVNCSSMTLYAIENALDGRTLNFTNYNDVLRGNYHDCVDYMAQNSPWAGLFWNAIVIDGGDAHGDLNCKMAPRLLNESLPGAVLTDSAGSSVPLIVKGSFKQLLPQHIVDEPLWFTPTMALVIAVLLVMLVVLVVWRRLKTRKN